MQQRKVKQIHEPGILRDSSTSLPPVTISNACAFSKFHLGFLAEVDVVIIEIVASEKSVIVPRFINNKAQGHTFHG